MLVEIHVLQSHGPSNPNRDDLGAPKTAMFGGVLRARISSQCIKRSVRRHPAFRESLDGCVGDRTLTFPVMVEEALKGCDIPQKEHEAIVAACTAIAVKKAKKGEGEDEEEVQEEEEVGKRTAQLIFLGPAEVSEFVRILGELRRDTSKDYKEFIAGKKDPTKSKKGDKFWPRLREAYTHNGTDIALFGRMTTSHAFENVEASMQVAHAISTHAVVPETDYYTTMDDLQPKDQPGAGFIDEAQYTSAVFYKYFSLDWDALVANLDGDDELARKTVRAFVETMAVAVPTGKRNSYANNNLPDAILVEVKERKVPTSYVNAFLQPTGRYSDSAGEHDVLDDSIRKLRHYAHKVSTAYELDPRKIWFSLRDDPEMDGKQMEDENLQSVGKLSELTEATLAALGK